MSVKNSIRLAMFVLGSAAMCSCQESGRGNQAQVTQATDDTAPQQVRNMDRSTAAGDTFFINNHQIIRWKQALSSGGGNTIRTDLGVGSGTWFVDKKLVTDMGPYWREMETGYCPHH